MTRFWLGLMMLACTQPAWAGGRDDAYYGPMMRGVGYQDRIEKDGSWRIEAVARGRRDAIDIALYRAAERARDAGYRYVFLLGASSRQGAGGESATLYARPSQDAVPPVGCRSKKLSTCYTADVAEVLRILGGPGGMTPGMPIVDHLDEYGREVFLSGYGTGGIVTLVPNGKVGSSMMTIIDGRLKIQSTPDRSAARTPPPSAMPTPPVAIAGMPPRPVVVVARSFPAAVVIPSHYSTALTAEERFERAKRAVQPIRGGDPRQGWTISD